MKEEDIKKLEELINIIHVEEGTFLEVQNFIQSLINQARQEGYEAGIKDELECVEKSGEHHTKCRQEERDLIAKKIEGLLEHYGVNAPHMFATMISRSHFINLITSPTSENSSSPEIT